jgi:hypothetical protein
MFSTHDSRIRKYRSSREIEIELSASATKAEPQRKETFTGISIDSNALKANANSSIRSELSSNSQTASK